MTRKKKILFSIFGLFFVSAASVAGFLVYNYLNHSPAAVKKISGIDLLLESDKDQKVDSEDKFSKDYLTQLDQFNDFFSDQNQDLAEEYGQRESFFEQLSLLDLEKITKNNVIFPEGYERFKFNTENNFVTKESDETFLGPKNNNLLVYDLNYPLVDNLIEENNNFKANILNQKFTIFDSKARNQIFKLNKIGAYAQPLNNSDKFDWIYQKNVKFKTGTAAILDSNNEKTLLITNNHVLRPLESYKYNDENFEIKTQKIRFWNILGGNFLEWYQNGKIYSLDSDNIAWLFYAKEIYEKKISSFDQAKFLEFVVNFYNDYFEIPSDFDNQKFDVGVFYFKYKKFIDDLKVLAKFYKDNKADILTKIQQNQSITDDNSAKNNSIESKFENFLATYQNFIDFWEKMVKEKPVQISEKVWKKGDSTYDFNVGLFWPKSKPMKNNFKGVYASDPQQNFSRLSLYFYTNNGPGASGSGVFNEKGELQFINGFGLINNFYDNNSRIEKNYYDKLNTNISLSGGIPLVTEDFNLTKLIKEFYPSNQKKGFTPIQNEKIVVNKK
ncbi:Mhp366/Mhp367 family surface (lipo)protein [Mesomycoplasma ovipneumoniae]